MRPFHPPLRTRALLPQSASKVHALPPVSSLIAETENLLHRQRQKGPEYKYREGTGRPDLVASGLLPASSGSAAASSPKKPSAPSAVDDAGGETAGPAELDDYDPKEAAARELRELTETVRGRAAARARSRRDGWTSPLTANRSPTPPAPHLTPHARAPLL